MQPLERIAPYTTTVPSTPTAPAFPPPATGKVRSLYNNFIINRHNDRIHTFMGCDVAKASHSNFNQVRTHLRMEASYLATCLSNEPPRPSPSISLPRLVDQITSYIIPAGAWLHSLITSPQGLIQKELKQEEYSHYTGLLTKRESLLFEFITCNLTLKHGTCSLEHLQKSHTMLSIKERERKNMPIQNRRIHTQFGIDDDIFFVMGVGNHPIPSSLDDTATHIISISTKCKSKMPTLQAVYGSHRTLVTICMSVQVTYST